jgi:hypothetical protein
VDVAAAAELMLALNDGILLLSVAGVRQVPLERLKPAYIAFLDAGLASRDQSMFPTAEPAGSRNGTSARGGY